MLLEELIKGKMLIKVFQQASRKGIHEFPPKFTKLLGFREVVTVLDGREC